MPDKTNNGIIQDDGINTATDDSFNNNSDHSADGSDNSDNSADGSDNSDNSLHADVDVTDSLNDNSDNSDNSADARYCCFIIDPLNVGRRRGLPPSQEFPSYRKN
jgi:hypothetical protein